MSIQLDMFDQGGAGEGVEDVSLQEAARTRYLNYALSVITARALPDVRDGLKPVQRRILYAMLHNLHLRPDARYRKSAAVVGEVMAKYHPHGDSAIYEAMVRMAQDFSLRYPLVDGQGNFGSLDGDPPAAMRYTEARLRTMAVELLEELGSDTVHFRPTYDGTTTEPVVLPAQVPNLLINGVTGIAVGMATNIPPHHLGEVVDACVALIDDPDLNTNELCAWVKGPDFPTGGLLLSSPEELIRIYETGEGPVRVRGEYTTETVGKTQQIVVTSIPYAVVKADLVTQIAEHIIQGKIPLITDVRDESTDVVRIVIELKKGADADLAMSYLFKHTDLQTSFHCNLTVLCPTDNPEVGSPSRLGLKEILRHFLDFRYQVLVRRLEHELKELLARIHILEGFEKIFDALDEAIAIIRASEDKPDAALRLRARFELSEIQAETILETRLHRLARLEILAIRQELLTRRARAHAIRELLASPQRLWGTVRSELAEVAARHTSPRRTVVAQAAPTITFKAEDFIVEEDCVVIVTRGGWFKRQKSYTGASSIRVKDGEEIGWIFETSTRKCVTFFTHLGTAYTLRADEIPSTSGHGEPVQRHFAFEDGERLVGVVVHDPLLLPAVVEELAPPPEPEGGGEGSPAEPEGEEEGEEALPPGVKMLALTRAGRCMRFALASHAEPSTRAGRRFARLDKAVKDDAVVAVVPCGGDELVCLVSEQSRRLVFPVSQVKVLRGAGQGVTAIKLPREDRLKVFCLARSPQEGIVVTTSRGRTELVGPPSRGKPGSRGGKGIQIIERGTITVEGPKLEIFSRPKVVDSTSNPLSN